MRFKNLHIFFFYIFLFSIPLQTRIVFLNDYSFYSGAFTEYTTYFLYLSDIFFIIAFIFWMISKKRLLKPICDKTIKTINANNRIWLYLISFILIISLNVIVKHSYLKISMFYYIKILELILLFIFLKNILKKQRILLNTLVILTISGFMQGLIAILQYVDQRSAFLNNSILRAITGEAHIGPNIPGVANFIVDGQRIIRPYGTFPHPNILAGFLILTLLITIYLYLESKNHNLSSQCHPNHSHNTIYNKCQVLLTFFIWVALISVQLSALLLTFSRSAWFSLFFSITIFVILYFIQKKNVSRETLKIHIIKQNFQKILRQYGELFITLALFISLVTFLFSAIYSRISVNHTKTDHIPENHALSDRIFYNIVSRETIYKNPLWGSGLGTNVFQIDDYLKRNNMNQDLSPWQYQPTHHIYILIASEIGILGLLIFLLFIFEIISEAIVNIQLATQNRQDDYFIAMDRQKINHKNTGKALFSDNIMNLLSLSKKIVSRETIYLKNYFFKQQSKKKILKRIKEKIHDKNQFLYIKESLCQLLRTWKNKSRYLAKSQVKTTDRNPLFNSHTKSQETFLINKTRLNSILLIIIISFLLIGLFDHYFWTLQQGRLMFWLILGILALNLKE